MSRRTKNAARSRAALIERLESRTLLSWGDVDPSYTVELSVSSGPTSSVAATDGTTYIHRNNIMWRFTPSGAIDTSFDYDGTLSIPGVDLIRSVLPTPDGKVVVVGTHYTDARIVVTRYTSTGSLDLTFSSDGIAEAPIPAFAGSAVLQPDGTILVVGDTDANAPVERDLVLVRFSQDGVLDTSVNRDDYALVDTGNPLERATKVQLMPDGRILVLLSTETSGYHTDLGSLVRLFPDGTIDRNFGSNGRLQFDDFLSGFIEDFDVRPDGRITVVGMSGRSAAVIQYLADGTPDSSFGTAGVATVLGSATPFEVAVRSDGTLRVAGIVQINNSNRGFTAALTPDGRLQPAYGSAGIAVLPSTSSVEIRDLATLANGDLVVGYVNQTLTSTFLIRRIGDVATGAAGGYVTGRLYDDANGNGRQDIGEGYLATSGVSLLLDANNNGVQDSGEKAALTDSTGTFAFSTVAAGTYQLCVTGTLSGRTLTQPNGSQFRTVIVSSTQRVIGQDFGFTSQSATVGTASGVVKHDLADNGLNDAGDPVLSGIKTYLDLNQNRRLDLGEPTSVTDTSGRWTFSNVVLGTYTLRIDAPGWRTAASTEHDQLPFAQVQFVPDDSDMNHLLLLTGRALVIGTVGSDSNSDGLSDSGLSGWTVYIDVNNDGVLNSGDLAAVTAADGSYRISKVAPGTYTVRQVLLSGWRSTKPLSGGIPVTLNAGSVARANFAATTDLSRTIIAGVAFKDLNYNGIRDAGEAVLGGRTIYVDANGNGVLDLGERHTITDLFTGEYRFHTLSAGTYVLRQDLRPDWIEAPAFANGLTFTVASGQIVANAHLGSRPGGVIAGNVFFDVDADGILDPEDAKFQGRSVYIDSNNNEFWDGEGIEVITATDPSGHYRIAGLLPDTYNLRVIRHDYTQQSLPKYNGAWIVTLGAGQTLLNCDFAYYYASGDPGVISGIVFDDLDADGTKDVGESGLANVRVYYDEDADGTFDSNEYSVMSDASGAYELDELPPNTYRVRAVLPAGYSVVSPSAGYYELSVTWNTVWMGQDFALARFTASGEFIVDNTAATLVGTWSASTGQLGFYGPNYLHDGKTGKGTNSATYTPNLLEAGTYDVYAMWTSDANRAGNVPYDIYHSGGIATVAKSQKTGGGTWQLLGTWSFNAGTGGKVVIRTTGTSGYVVADAVRFVKRTTPPPPPPSGEVIVDNTTATTSGTWTASTGTPGYNGSNYLHDGNAGKGTKSVTFTAMLPEVGSYEVYAKWTSDTNRASNAPYDIYTSTGVQTVARDQRTQGGQWVLLGTFSFSTTTGKVVLRNGGTTGYVIADAVKFVKSTTTPPSPDEVVKDNPQATPIGTWTTSTGTAGFYGSNYLHDGNTGKGTKSVAWDAGAISGTYAVYARWTSDANRASNAPYDVHHGGGTSTVVKSQKVNGGSWQLLGTYTFSGTGKVVLRNAGTDGYVIADAVRFVKITTAPASEYILDDSAALLSGLWTGASSSTGFYGSGYLHDGNTGQGTKSATWTPDLEEAGTYQVYARWTSHSNRASNARYDVLHAGGTSTVYADQRVGGGTWVLLGTFTFNAGTAGSITLRNDGADGYVIADAVRLVKVS